MLRRRCLIVVIVLIIVAVYWIEPAHSHSYEKPLTGNQVVKAIDDFFGRETKTLDWHAAIVAKSGKVTWLLSDQVILKLAPAEAFGEGNDYYYYSEVDGMNLVFSDEIERICIYWSRQNVLNDTDISYSVYDTDADGEWDTALVFPVNLRTREFGSDKFNLSGNVTARGVEDKHLIEYML